MSREVQQRYARHLGTMFEKTGVFAAGGKIYLSERLLMRILSRCLAQVCKQAANELK